MPRPPFSRRPDDEEDPTGIHDLLSSLPDPGPMPADLTQRISDILAEEQRARSDGAGPWTGRSPARRLTTPRVIGGLAAAAAVAAVAAVGINALGGIGSSPPPASTQAELTQGANRSSPGGASEFAAAPAHPETVPQPQRGAAVSARQVAGIRIHTTGTDYTTTTFAQRAQQLVVAAGPAEEPNQPLSAGVDRWGPMAVPSGVRDCLTAQRIAASGDVIVDLATFEGRPAAVLVTENGQRQRQARVVSRDCGIGRAQQPLAGPVSLTTS